MYPDFLTCGKCADEFPLSKIDDFIIHKTSCLHSQYGQDYTFLPDTVLNHPVLSCMQCGRDFHTARGLLQHVQISHNMGVAMQMSPISSQHVFSRNQQNSSAAGAPAPVSQYAAANSSGLTVSTSSDNNSSNITHMSDNVHMSPSVKQELPVTCAKLAASEGTTICCNGQECKVTINPPSKKEQTKKCCSSVIPKKRTRHMQEHDSEDMEQSALKTLAGFRGRFLLSHKSKSSHSRLCKKKGGDTSNSTHKRKARCVLRCETKSGKVIRVKNTDVCEEEGVEEAEVQEIEEEEEISREIQEEECHKASTDDTSDCESPCDQAETEQKIKVYSIEKESITSRKTVIINSGVTMTLEPTETTLSKQQQGGHKTPDPTFPPPSAARSQAFDASRESAEILAELLCHARQPPVDHTISGSEPQEHNISYAPLASMPDSGIHPVTHPSASAVIPPNIVYPPGDPTVFNNAFTSADVTSSISNPVETNAHLPGSKLPTQFIPSTSMDIQQLDLNTVSPTISIFDSLDHTSDDGLTMSLPEAAVSLNGGASVTELKQDSPGGSSGKMTSSGKKRRYPTTRPYKCSQCDQAFNQPIHLKKHMSKHTGVKPFKCDQCEYSTVERSHLKAHNRIHTGEKPFQCNFCSYATAQNSTLRVHLKRHHGGQLHGAIHQP